MYKVLLLSLLVSSCSIWADWHCKRTYVTDESRASCHRYQDEQYRKAQKHYWFLP